MDDTASLHVARQAIQLALQATLAEQRRRRPKPKRSPEEKRQRKNAESRSTGERRRRKLRIGMTPGQRAARAEYRLLREQRAARFNSVQPLGRPRLHAKHGQPPEYPV